MFCAALVDEPEKLQAAKSGTDPKLVPLVAALLYTHTLTHTTQRHTLICTISFEVQSPQPDSL